VLSQRTNPACLVYATKMYVGFSGRAQGITPEQTAKLCSLLLQEFTGWHGLHNDGEGSAQVFGKIASSMGFMVDTTPSDISPMRRNRYLVAQSDALVAIPPCDQIVKKGSGTWETIKYMWKAGKPVHIILSDGRICRTKSDFSL
jgi:hypothetical protein